MNAGDEPTVKIMSQADRVVDIAISVFQVQTRNIKGPSYYERGIFLCTTHYHRTLLSVWLPYIHSPNTIFVILILQCVECQVV